jgi:hypothetical protein
MAGVVACGIKLLRAFGIGATKRPLNFQTDNTIEGIVVNRSSAVSESSLPRRAALSRAEGPP